MAFLNGSILLWFPRIYQVVDYLISLARLVKEVDPGVKWIGAFLVSGVSVGKIGSVIGLDRFDDK